ncbi:hypothetical protein D3C86_1755520 [compost metagenome]
MLSIWKINPDSIIDGRNAALSATCAALNWLRVMVEISRPMPSVLSKNRLVIRNSKISEPRYGTPRINTDTSIQSSIASIPRK